MSEHIERKHKVQNMCKSEFYAIVENTMLDQIDMEIMIAVYVEHKELAIIAEHVGLSESQVRKRHKRALKKIADKL